MESGYRHIDTASVYDNEEYVGLGIADAIAKGIVKREDVFVTTKLWNDKHATEEVVKSLRESLKRLRLDYVDLFLIHFPLAFKANGSLDYNIDYLDTWKGMEEAKRLGLAKSIGVSNFNAKQIDRIIDNSKIRPAVNEIEVHPTLTQVPLVEHCQKLGVVVMAYSPFGFLVNRNKNALPPKSDNPILLKIAAKYGKNTGQVVLRYLIDRDLIPIPKSSKKERIKQNINVFDFHLTNEEINEINMFNMNTSVFGENEEWKSHPYYPF